MSASSQTAPVARKFINQPRKRRVAADRVFTARQVIRMLDITDRTLTNWRIGKFQARRPLEVLHPDPKSRRFVIAESELTAWLKDYRDEHNDDLYARWIGGLAHVGRASD